MGHLPQIEALVFALKGGSPGTEIVFLNQNLAIRPASIVRRFHAHLLGALPHCLLDFVDEPRDRPRLVKFHHDLFGRVGTRADPARPSRAGLSIEQSFNRVSGVQPSGSPPLRNRKFADSPLEGSGFEISVPRFSRAATGAPLTRGLHGEPAAAARHSYLMRS